MNDCPQRDVNISVLFCSPSVLLPPWLSYWTTFVGDRHLLNGPALFDRSRTRCWSVRFTRLSSAHHHQAIDRSVDQSIVRWMDCGSPPSIHPIDSTRTLAVLSYPIRSLQPLNTVPRLPLCGLQSVSSGIDQSPCAAAAKHRGRF